MPHLRSNSTSANNAILSLESMDGGEIIRRLADLREKIVDSKDEAGAILSSDAVPAQGIPFMIGGYVSVSTVLASLSYLLSLDQEVQVRSRWYYLSLLSAQLNF